MDSFDHQCPNCSRIFPVPEAYWDRTIRCPECGEDLTADKTTIPPRPHWEYQKVPSPSQMEVEQASRSKMILADLGGSSSLAAPVADDHENKPFDGMSLIVASVGASILGCLLLFAPNDAVVVVGFIVLWIAGMLYLAGIIRWAVSGSQFLQLDHLQRQNVEIIELLKTIAHKDRK